MCVVVNMWRRDGESILFFGPNFPSGNFCSHIFCDFAKFPISCVWHELFYVGFLSLVTEDRIWNNILALLGYWFTAEILVLYDDLNKCTKTSSVEYFI